MLTEVRLTQIKDSPYQTRFDLGDIEALAQNMNAYGLQQPPTVRPLSNEEYETVYGSRRIAAARLLGWENIACFVKDLSDEEAAEIAISENLQRENLNPIEEALSFQILKESFHCTQSEIAERVNKSRSYIANSLGLLNIDPFLQACLICELFTISHIRLINSLPPEIPAYRVADIVVDWKLSVRELEEVIKQIETDGLIQWTREVPIADIIIPLAAFDPNSVLKAGIVVIDSRHVLVSGFTELVEEKKSGKNTVTATVVYYREWLHPDEDTPLYEKSAENDPNFEINTKFTRVLAKLMADPAKMFLMYPIHIFPRKGPHLRFLPD